MAGKFHLLICEGNTDFALLQYYMEKVNGWRDIKDDEIQKSRLKINKNRSRNLIRGEDPNLDILTISAAGGCENLTLGLESALERNFNSKPDLSDAYNRIVMIRDRDDQESEGAFLGDVETILKNHNVIHEDVLVNNVWIICEMETQMKIPYKFSLLLLVIPFEENGAMETFLLDAISDKDPYDKVIIDKCRQFVDDVDPEKRYLNKRRIVTKAKFDTYFSVRTSAEQFTQRRDIIKNVKWEDYIKIQEDFKELAAI